MMDIHSIADGFEENMGWTSITRCPALKLSLSLPLGIRIIRLVHSLVRQKILKILMG
jgi:hypothetical protein